MEKIDYFDLFAKLKMSEYEIKKELEIVEEELIRYMQDNELKSVGHDEGEIIFYTTHRHTYSDGVKKKEKELRELKNQEIDDGVANKKEIKCLRFKLK